MDVKTYRARSMQEALALVRRDLGPQAAVLHTREVHGGGLFSWIPGLRRIEVTAALNVNVPSRLPQRELVSSAAASNATHSAATVTAPPAPVATAHAAVVTNVATLPAKTPSPDQRAVFREEVRGQLNELQTMVEDLCRRSKVGSQRGDLPQELFHLYTDLLDAEIAEETVRSLVERVKHAAPIETWHDLSALRARIARMVEEELSIAGPLAMQTGRCRKVALVGPTGVGKTTTIAKLAANYRLREKRNVGLITVDTYRIAAVEQLRTYAEIIDLPMEVVSTPREMREAVARLSHLDLVLIDTAGRSPKDEVQIQELKAFLHEAAADEVHLVLSSVAGASTLERTAQRFAEVGTTALILTKFDEAAALGHLMPLVCNRRYPVSYITNGQNVPDDITPAERPLLARLVLGMENA